MYNVVAEAVMWQERRHLARLLERRTQIGPCFEDVKYEEGYLYKQTCKIIRDCQKNLSGPGNKWQTWTGVGHNFHHDHQKPLNSSIILAINISFT